MQPLAAGLVLEAALAGVPVLLAGGSQMAAVLAVALSLCDPSLRPLLVSRTAIATTAWVAGESSSDLAQLLEQIGQRWGVQPLAFASSLRFHACRSPQLLAFEQGYVKEGVGAGGLAALWELSGRSANALAVACDQACSRLV
jgi:NaMN:DMB phosphoribosyltransferase